MSNIKMEVLLVPLALPLVPHLLLLVLLHHLLLLHHKGLLPLLGRII
jgi:hypothetical protein